MSRPTMAATATLTLVGIFELTQARMSIAKAVISFIVTSLI